MKEIPRISEAEWEVMRVFWLDSPATATDIIQTLSERTDWKPKTIKTLISRLVKKEVLSFTQKGRMYYYYPLIGEDECIKAEKKSFLQRIYGGALQPMLVQFIQDEELSPEEIQELKNILEEKEK